jgi:hypothetical protein
VSVGKKPSANRHRSVKRFETLFLNLEQTVGKKKDVRKAMENQE